MNIPIKLSNRRLLFIIPLLLVVATTAVYWQIHGFDFVNFDDNEYVFENTHVKNGITAKNIIWAFTAFHSGNWHPLTWLSHMLDCQIFGLWAGGHHLTNLLFHILNTILLFFVFQKMTGKAWQSGFVAALFALHPLHVESVAWISERKDVLSTFFWLLTLMAYIRYVQRPRFSTWAWVFLSFIFGLMSKPMVVTLPFVLLLLDFWPLNRFSLQKNARNDKLSVFHLIAEKVPLFALSAVSCVITINAQRQGAAITSLSVLPFTLRISNALVAYATYIINMLYPFNLTVLYPFHRIIPWWKIAVAVAVLSSISFVSLRSIKNRPYLIVGWLWYIGTLVPVIGLVQIGRQSMADRYTYIPLIGLFVMIAWFIPQLTSQWRHKAAWLSVSGSLIIFMLMVLSWNQIRHWKNSISLFKDALEKTSDNYVAHNNLGEALDNQGQIEDAANHYRQALRINPYYMEAQNNLGQVLFRQGKINDAIIHLRKALKLNPNIPEIHINLGLALCKQGRIDEAIHHFLEAIKLNPNLTGPNLYAANAFYVRGKMDEAIMYYQKALKQTPDSAEVQSDLAAALYQKGYTDQAIAHYLKAIQLNPVLPETFNNLGVAYISKKDINHAIQSFRRALALKPEYPNAKDNLNKALLLKKQSDRANRK